MCRTGKLREHKSKFKYLEAQHEVTKGAVNQRLIKLSKIQPNSLPSPETSASCVQREGHAKAESHHGEKRRG